MVRSDIRMALYNKTGIEPDWIQRYYIDSINFEDVNSEKTSPRSDLIDLRQQLEGGISCFGLILHLFMITSRPGKL